MAAVRRTDGVDEERTALAVDVAHQRLAEEAGEEHLEALAPGQHVPHRDRVDEARGDEALLPPRAARSRAGQDTDEAGFAVVLATAQDTHGDDLVTGGLGIEVASRDLHQLSARLPGPADALHRDGPGQLQRSEATVAPSEESDAPELVHGDDLVPREPGVELAAGHAVDADVALVGDVEGPAIGEHRGTGDGIDAAHAAPRPVPAGCAGDEGNGEESESDRDPVHGALASAAGCRSHSRARPRRRRDGRARPASPARPRAWARPSPPARSADRRTSRRRT